MEVAAGVPQNAMRDFLDGLHSRHGGAVEYLSGIGVSDAMMDDVRAAFLT